jgi:hypothetical protein
MFQRRAMFPTLYNLNDWKIEDDTKLKLEIEKVNIETGKTDTSTFNTTNKNKETNKKNKSNHQNIFVLF